jgi:hypothetical protein
VDKELRGESNIEQKRHGIKLRVESKTKERGGITGR